jgi:anti-anti-sigma factor
LQCRRAPIEARGQKYDEARRLQNAALREESVRSARDVLFHGMNVSDPDDQAVNRRTAQDLEAVLATQSGPVVVDLRKLSFIDLTGLRVLLDADARSRQDGMNLRFIPGRMVRRLLEVAELPDRLPYVEPRPK